jgi:hypothetical protein
VVQGAIMAGIPIVCEPEEDVLALIADGDRVEVDGSGTIRVGRKAVANVAGDLGGRPRRDVE